MKRCRIAYVGNYRPEYSTETFIAAALERAGHHVIRLQEDDTPWDARLQRTLDENADLFLYTRTWDGDWADGIRVLAALRDNEIVSASIHLDLYLGLERENQVTRQNPFWSTDHCFTADGHPDHAKEFEARGINHHWLLPGVDPEVTTGTFREEFACDVAFIGSYRYHPEWPYRRQLINALRARYGDHYRHFGGGLGPNVRGRDLDDVAASAKVIIGDACNPGFALAAYWSDRVYEMLGRGAFLIHPDIPGLEDEFTDGEHLVLYDYGNFEQLFDLIDLYVPDEGSRRAIGAAGRDRTLSTSTWDHRIAELSDVLTEAHPHLRSMRERIVIRPDTTDAEVVREIWDEEVYRLRDKGIEGGIVIDGGANIGAFTLFALEQLGASHVHAIEPNTAALLTNLDTCAEQGSNVSVLEGALGREDGIGQVIGIDANAFVTARARYLNHAVGVWSLDTFFRQNQFDEVALLKLDIEGAEFGVIAGASRETLARIKNIVIEFHAPPILGGRDPGGTLGPLVEKLAETHHIEVIGRPSVGGMVYGHRYPAIPDSNLETA